VLILLDENLLSKKLNQPFLETAHSVNNVYDMGCLIPLMVQVSSIVESLPVGAAIRINDAGDVVPISP
jgi:hypothetical protein